MGRTLSSRFLRQWRPVILLAGFVLILAILAFGTSRGAGLSPTPTPPPTPTPTANLTHTLVSLLSSLLDYIGRLAVFAFVALIFWRFLVVFTSKSINQDDIRRMVKFCYAFTLISILVSVSPPLVFVTLSSSWIETLYQAALESPLGIVRGCVHVPKNGDQTWELACRSEQDKYADQWIVNIGGSVLLRSTPTPTPAPTVSTSPTPASASAPVLGTSTLSRRSTDRAAVTKLQQRLVDLGFHPGGVDGKFGRRTEGAVRAFQKTKSLGATGNADPPTLTALGMSAPPPPEGTPSTSAVSTSPSATAKRTEQLQESTLFPAVTIHGGLAVPWYFITLALMGAAISISRKVPEYQRRVFFDSVRKLKILKEGETPLSPEVIREYLVFQILQFLYAPFVAIVAYYAVKPAGAAGSVALGFVSGFSSPAVLLLINGALERATGLETAKAVDAAKAERTIEEAAAVAAAQKESITRLTAGIHDAAALAAVDALVAGLRASVGLGGAPEFGQESG